MILIHIRQALAATALLAAACGDDVTAPDTAPARPPEVVPERPHQRPRPEPDRPSFCDRIAGERAEAAVSASTGAVPQCR